MPRLGKSADLEQHKIAGSTFKFSAARIEDLGASEYTLATIVVDDSGSVYDFRDPIEKSLKEVLKACRRSPRADNLMLRVLTFSHRVIEVHGFKPLMDCNENDYTGCIGRQGGTTSLFDACFNAVKSAAAYGKQLVANDFDVNACVFIITDGCDNTSTSTAKMVKDAIAEARKNENLESIMPVLIGVNITDPDVQHALDDFQRGANFQQYVELKDANEKTLAKLGGFISKSISSTSQALGTGGPSQSLTF